MPEVQIYGHEDTLAVKARRSYVESWPFPDERFPFPAERQPFPDDGVSFPAERRPFLTELW